MDEPFREVMAMTTRHNFCINTSKGSNGLSPMFIAVGLRVGALASEDGLKFVLGFKGVDPNMQVSKYGFTALHIVAYRGLSRFVKLLLDAPGTDVNLPNTKGETPHSGAASRGHPECPSGRSTAALLLPHTTS